MRVTHLGHSALLVEANAARVLIDPGVLSDAWHGLRDLDAVLVTHVHPDHLDPAAAAELHRGNPTASWHVEPSVLDLLPQGARGSALPAEQSLTVGDLTVVAVGGTHASVHPDLPRAGTSG